MGMSNIFSSCKEIEEKEVSTYLHTKFYDDLYLILCELRLTTCFNMRIFWQKEKSPTVIKFFFPIEKCCREMVSKSP